MTDRTAQRRELQPEDEAAVREFIENAEPEVKAWLTLVDQPMQLEVLDDPDRASRPFSDATSSCCHYANIRRSRFPMFSSVFAENRE